MARDPDTRRQLATKYNVSEKMVYKFCGADDLDSIYLDSNGLEYMNEGRK